MIGMGVMVVVGEDVAVVPVIVMDVVIMAVVVVVGAVVIVVTAVAVPVVVAAVAVHVVNVVGCQPPLVLYRKSPSGHVAALRRFPACLAFSR